MAFLTVLLLGLAVWGIGRCWPCRPVPKHPWFEGLPETVVIGHRGASGHRPENTLAAFIQALEMGADAIELDVRRSADGQWVVFHDDSLERTTNGQGIVAAHDLASLQSLDAGYRFDPDNTGRFPWRGRGITIPTLDEVMEGLPENTRLVVEIKDQGPDAASALIDKLKAHPEWWSQMMINAFDPKPIRALRQNLPQVATGATSPDIARFWLGAHLRWVGFLWPPFEAFQIPEKHGPLTLVTPALVRAAHRLGVPVQVWTVNQPESMTRLLDLGVQGLITDFPDRARAVLQVRQ